MVEKNTRTVEKESTRRAKMTFDNYRPNLRSKGFHFLLRMKSKTFVIVSWEAIGCPTHVGPNKKDEEEDGGDDMGYRGRQRNRTPHVEQILFRKKTEGPSLSTHCAR